ncbi:hypothetical protein UFOVP760_71 [uncultured Caudovirales phage]|uniref:Uncharacterized protein n=1 Tax=uncultured Caudovirales phage TaxID=2100421 RepID=A0A6J7XEK9_9CAUD|nr:hypothetical protein UFOVP760_71 [uncultured Caudovirales phage]
MSMRFVVERWTGRAWDSFPGLSFKTMSEVSKHLKTYSWHYTADNPYRIVDARPKKKSRKYTNPFHRWNSDEGMVVKI